MSKNYRTSKTVAQRGLIYPLPQSKLIPACIADKYSQLPHTPTIPTSHTHTLSPCSLRCCCCCCCCCHYHCHYGLFCVHFCCIFGGDRRPAVSGPDASTCPGPCRAAEHHSGAGQGRAVRNIHPAAEGEPRRRADQQPAEQLLQRAHRLRAGRRRLQFSQVRHSELALSAGPDRARPLPRPPQVLHPVDVRHDEQPFEHAGVGRGRRRRHAERDDRHRGGAAGERVDRRRRDADRQRPRHRLPPRRLLRRQGPPPLRPLWRQAPRLCARSRRQAREEPEERRGLGGARRGQ